MHRLLTIALSGLLVVPLVGVSGGPVQADPPLIQPVVTLDVSPGQVPAGDVVHMVATVERPQSDPGADVPGQVRFSVAAHASNLWEDGSAEFGPVSLDAGSASFDFQILAHDLPFLEPEDTELWVSARYEPVDEAAFETYPEFDYAEGTSQRVTIGPLITTTTVTGPVSATAGSPTALTASVSPATAMGTVQFLVDGSPVGSPVSLASGTASLPHTFASAGTATVGALYTSQQAAVWADSQYLPGLSVTVNGTTPPPPAPTATTTTVTGPTTATVGTPTTLSASVSPAMAAGTVQFSVDGAPVGSPVAVSGGAASTSHTFAVGGVRQVAASFLPADPTAYVGSADSSGLAVSVDPASTTITITGPDAAKVGEVSTLSATVQPAQATGSVEFYVDGDLVDAVALDGGAAATSYTFASEGEASVGAVFEPAEAGTYRTAAASPRVVDVEPGTSSETTTDTVSTVDVVSETDGCSGGGRASRPVGVGTVLRDPLPIDLTSYFSGVFVDMHMFVQSFILGTQDWIWANFMDFGAISDIIGRFMDGFMHIGPYSGDPCARGQRADRAPRADDAVQCVLVEGAGYWCPVDLPADSKLTLSVSVPLPPEAAGKRVMVKTTLKKVDPETGELVRIGDGRTKTDVPRRTTLSARLAPVKSDLESVPPGGSAGYRLLVRNTGKVSADRVRTCVNLGKGARVVDAARADVGARRACWTLRDLGKGEAVARTLTLRAPDTSGPLRIVATVNPRKGQADPLRLTTLLDVT